MAKRIRCAFVFLSIMAALSSCAHQSPSTPAEFDGVIESDAPLTAEQLRDGILVVLAEVTMAEIIAEACAQLALDADALFSRGEEVKGALSRAFREEPTADAAAPMLERIANFTQDPEYSVFVAEKLADYARRHDIDLSDRITLCRAGRRAIDGGDAVGRLLREL